MTTVLYPGSFDPWHKGHEDILYKASQIFDKIIVARGINLDKPSPAFAFCKLEQAVMDTGIKEKHIEVAAFQGLTTEFAIKREVDAIIRGLRNGNDLEYEKNYQYWNEDLGLEIPTVYFLCDRNFSHISSSTIRAIEKMKGA